MFAYLVVNRVNGKKYVGITAKPAKRWRDHLFLAERSRKHALHHAIEKYGAEVFSYEVIAGARTWSDLCWLESALIAQHGTFVADGHGYNMTRGGEGTPGRKCGPAEIEARRARIGVMHTPEAKAKAAAARRPGQRAKAEATKAAKADRQQARPRARGWKWSDEARQAFAEKCQGRHVSDETRRKLSEAATGKPSPMGMLGKRMSPEAKAKIGSALRGKPKSEETRRKMSEAACARGKRKAGPPGPEAEGS